MQLLDQLGRERGRQLVGDPRGQVALGVGVGDVAHAAPAARQRGNVEA